MLPAERPPANAFVAFMRKIYNPIGFSKGYNALLWFIFDGALFGFLLARAQYLNFWGVFCNPDGSGTTPGECYWYTAFDRNRIGLQVHLYTIIPAGFLAVFQFVPIIRYKALLWHRMAGYVILLLTLISNAGALSIANHAFGGDNTTRIFIGVLAIMTTGSLAIAIYNVKRLQIEQHRAWMLRAWFYFACIITLRIIQILIVEVSAIWGGEATQYTAISCNELLAINGGNSDYTYATYPMCSPSASQYAPDGMAVVRADFVPTSGRGDATNVQAGLSVAFGSAGLLALILHAIGVEVYLRLTPRESERLRKVSYERQLERGFRNPGSAGLTADSLGDAEPWTPDFRETRKESSGFRIPLAGASTQDVSNGKELVSPMALTALPPW